MRLFEHPDFDQVILQAAEQFQLRPAIIEKDYYVTEVLRIIAATAGDKIIFKGGTSLSKGWNLIQRFSEDIDIFLDPLAFEPPLTKRGIDRELKSLRDAVASHPALQFVPEESQTIGGFGRNDRFSYHQIHRGPGEVANRVLLEAGAASGREPTVNVELRSYLGQFLQERGVTLGAEDESSFPMRLLHFRRTFVEKMFAIHSKVEILKRDGRALGTYARHYYDLFQLASRPEILEMLQSTEYEEIKHDYDRITRADEDRGHRLSRLSFERIAKEGRKFGFSLIIASQRPSEISATIISQCANFISHRLQNPDDIEHFRRIIPIQARRLLDQVTILASGEAIVFGSAFHVPARVQFDRPEPGPYSQTAAPYHEWSKETAVFPLDAVLSAWGIKDDEPQTLSPEAAFGQDDDDIPF